MRTRKASNPLALRGSEATEPGKKGNLELVLTKKNPFKTPLKSVCWSKKIPDCVCVRQGSVGSAQGQRAQAALASRVLLNTTSG